MPVPKKDAATEMAELLLVMGGAPNSDGHSIDELAKLLDWPRDRVIDHVVRLGGRVRFGKFRVGPKSVKKYALKT